MNEFAPRTRVAESNVRHIARGAEPFEEETLDSIKAELTEYRQEQWRMTPLLLIAILQERVNWPQTKALMRGILPADASNDDVVAAADRFTEWAEKTRKGVA
jgi:hypothetical protein